MIGIRIEINQGQFQKLTNKLADWERKQVVGQTTQEVAEFMQTKMQDYPTQKSVTRREAYGVTFFSAKQRRWFFAALRSGELRIPYQRTQRLAAGWHIVRKDKSALLTNSTSYAGLVQERGQQSRMMTRIGWHTVSYWLQRYSSQIGRVGLQNVRRWKNG